jgi:hypothetical protein
MSREDLDAPQRSLRTAIPATAVPTWLIRLIHMKYNDYIHMEQTAEARQGRGSRQKQPGKNCRP